MKTILTVLIFLLSTCSYSQGDTKIIVFQHTGEIDKAMTSVILSNKEIKTVKGHEILQHQDLTYFYKIDNELLSAIIENMFNNKNVEKAHEELIGVFMTTVEQKGKIVYYINRTFSDAKNTITGLIAFLKTRKGTKGFVEKFERINKEIDALSK